MLAGLLGSLGLVLVSLERLGGIGAFVLPTVYSVVLFVAARLLVSRGRNRLAGPIAGVAVLFVSLAVHGLEHWLGILVEEGPPPRSLWELISSHEFQIAVAAMLAAFAALARLRLPFLAAVSLCAIWFAVQVGAPVAFGDSVNFSQRMLLSSLVGLVGLGAGFAVDGRTRCDYARWFYLAGLVAFAGGALTRHAGAIIPVEVVAVVWLSFLALVLRRRMFAAFAAIGLASVLGEAAESLVSTVELLAFVAIALAVAGAALAYNKFELVWSKAVIAWLPEIFRRALPRHARE